MRYTYCHKVITTCNEESCEASLIDYEVLVKLCFNLKDDETAKFKSRKKIEKKVNRTKDTRNFLNLISLNDVLDKIAAYQRWSQLEKASAFERKFARKNWRLK